MSPRNTHTLFTSRLRLAPAALEDVELLAGMRDGPGAPEAGHTERVRALVAANPERFAAHGFGLWVVRASGEGRAGAAVGWIGLRPRESPLEPELLYGLSSESRGKGFATEAAGAVLDRLFVAPAVTGVWAVTDPTNLASCRVLERLGMRLDFEGEFDGKPSRVYRLARDGWRDPRRTTARGARRG